MSPRQLEISPIHDELFFHQSKFGLHLTRNKGKRGLFKNSSHVPIRAPRVTPSDFKRTFDFLSSLKSSPYVLIVSLIIGYFTLARQNDLVITSATIDDCPTTQLHTRTT